jgi:outer membrane protein OmpA-like peptidoglycan-associated protein
MRLGVCIIATIAIALVLVSVIYAKDAANAKVTVKNTTPAASTAPASPNSAGPLPSSPATSEKPKSGDATRPVRAVDKTDQSEEVTPKAEWFAGYSFWRAAPTALSNRMGYLHGGSSSFAYNLNRIVGLVADFGGYDDSRLTLIGPAGSQTVGSNGSAYTYAFGPRFSYRRERFTPFAQGLFGATHGSSVSISGCSGSFSCKPLASDNAFASMVGAGIDIKLSRHFALRLLEGDFLLTHFKDPLSANGEERGWQKNVRLSTGIVFRFGGSAPPPLSAFVATTCSADPEVFYEGSANYVTLRADASADNGNSLSYSWLASEGLINGSGAEVRWNSLDRPPGAYTFKVRVDAGRSGSAVCSVNVRVEPRPSRPTAISCSADHRAVTAGHPVEITAVASGGDNSPLSYSWSTSGGTIDGSGSSVKFQTAELAPGSYKITGHVTRHRTDSADCTVLVDVQLAEPPAEARQLEEALALHSIYFATGRPTAANTTGGLVESQQDVLLSLATDFNRYLTFKPQAHLILRGHADDRGSVEYNKDLTDRRVQLSKSFLVEHGVPAENIETQALGKADNLSADQVEQLIQRNSDLSNDERQRIESNLHVIVLANNRRVDISLNTTGQQSSRQYPFNAKDSLVLLSTKEK